MLETFKDKPSSLLKERSKPGLEESGGNCDEMCLISAFNEMYDSGGIYTTRASLSLNEI